MADDDLLSAEHDAKFKKWLQNKTLRDKAFDYLKMLDPLRAEEDDSLKEVAGSLQAVERVMGTGGSSSMDEDGDDTENRNNSTVSLLLLLLYFSNHIHTCAPSMHTFSYSWLYHGS